MSNDQPPMRRPAEAFINAALAPRAEDRFDALYEALDFVAYAPTDVLVDLAGADMPYLETTMLWNELRFRRSSSLAYRESDSEVVVDDEVINTTRDVLGAKIANWGIGESNG